MFERYTEAARRAIFFARAVTLLNDAPAIDPVHLLYGLMWEDSFRAQELFRLREIFPLHCGCPYKYATLEAVPTRDPQLTYESKKILARTAWEADSMQDYWIDTEHMLLGILHARNCLAARHLGMAGITLQDARRMVRENKPSRPDYGPVPPRPTQAPLERLLSKWRVWRYLRG
jgi:ATP-dependent Clp protease ATP-binding subunit ClpA